MAMSSTPTSVGSYTEADVRAQSKWQAKVNKLTVAQFRRTAGGQGREAAGHQS